MIRKERERERLKVKERTRELTDTVASSEQNGSGNCVKASFQISITVGSSLRRENHRGIMYLLSSITGSTGSPSRSRRRLRPGRRSVLSLSLNPRDSSSPSPLPPPHSLSLSSHSVINICPTITARPTPLMPRRRQDTFRRRIDPSRVGRSALDVKHVAVYR